VDDGLVSHDSHGLSSSVKVTAFGQGNHPVGPALQLLGLGIRRPNPTMLKKGSHHVTEHGITMASRTVQFFSRFLMPH
jgi:hypothetical protein